MADKENENTIVSLSEQHKWFILEEKELPSSILGYRSVQVDATERMYIYRNGVLHKKLDPGPYRWWSGFFNTWKSQRINMRIEQLPIRVKGRVKGPALPKDTPAAAAGVELACKVQSNLELTCKLVNIDTFLQYREPLSAFEASVSNMVIEEIAKLAYDQQGQWAPQLRDMLKRRLNSDSRENPLYQIGVAVLDVFVTNFTADSAYDEEMLRKFKLIERAHNELIKAQSQAQISGLKAMSQAEQARILGSSPILMKIMEELQDDSVGRVLIQQDAELRKVGMGIGAGFSPSSPSSPAGQLGPGPQGPVGYINSPSFDNMPPAQAPYPNNAFPGNAAYGNLAQGNMSYPNNGFFGNPQAGNLPYGSPQQSNPLYPPYGAQVTGSISPSVSPPPFAPTPSRAMPGWDEPVAPERRERELQALRQAGLEPDAKVEPSYDEYGQPIPGSKEWAVSIYIPRPNDNYLTVVFHCPMGYPQQPPKVQVRRARGGFRWLVPNTVSSWQPERLLLEVAQEVNRDIPDVL